MTATGVGMTGSTPRNAAELGRFGVSSIQIVNLSKDGRGDKAYPGMAPFRGVETAP